MARTKSTRLEQAILETLWVNRIGVRLTLTRNLALIVAAVIALAAPLAAGAITAPLRWPANILIDRTKRPPSGETAAAQEKFEAASIKPNTSRTRQFGLNAEPGGRLTATNVTLSSWC